ncbi:alkane oxidation protein activator PraB [Pseudomonas sp. 18175]|uniref:alkane oxidation protein activator PraB n=1 Tax=Pseudomonas sp. 18175 TaxID=3390056 RepID=UPI003D247064
MKVFNGLLSFISIIFCVSAASNVGAYSLSPLNQSFTASGTVVVKSPSSVQLPVSCNVTLSGYVDSMGLGRFTLATMSGSSALCNTPQATLNYPMKWTPTSLVGSFSMGNLENMGYHVSLVTGASSHCGPSTVAVFYDNVMRQLTSSNQPLSGSCTLSSLNVLVVSTFPIVVIP